MGTSLPFRDRDTQVAFVFGPPDGGASPLRQPLAGTTRLDQAGRMTPEPVPHPGRRFPAGVVSRAVWRHRVFSLNPRDVEPVRAERGILFNHESIRQRRLWFGADLTGEPRRRRPRPGDTGCLDEVFIRMNGTVP